MTGAQPALDTQLAAPEAEPQASTNDQIQMRAYEIYLERHGAPGNALGDWIQAERELLAKPVKAKATRSTNGRTSNGRTTKAKSL